MSKIQIRRGTTAEWAAANPTLAAGEPGLDTTTGSLKVGDGITAWLSLPPPDRRGSGAPGGTGIAGERYYDYTAKRDYLSDGVGWIIMREPEQTDTPTWTSVTLGSPGQISERRWQRSAGYIDWYARFVLGTGGSVTGQIVIPTPVAFGVNARYVHAVVLLDSANNNYRGLSEGTGAGATSIAIFSVGGPNTLEYAIGTGAAAPFGWNAGDGVTIQGHAKMNTPYL